MVFCKKDNTKKEGNYQNLNLTTIQPNLNLRLGLTWLLLFTPTPPPASNSTFTRNKGPGDLNFCRQPHQTKLTTTQNSLKPSSILLLGLSLPDFVLTKKIYNCNVFEPGYIWPKKKFEEIFLNQTFLTQKFFWPKIFDLNFLTKKVFLNFFNKFYLPNIFDT